MTMVLRPGQTADDLVVAGNGACPPCGGDLRPWGQARSRIARSGAGERGYRPRRVRCGACGVTQVVLPPDVLVRRRDEVAVVGAAWRAFAAGASARRAARWLGVPMETVRGWLRRLREHADVASGSRHGDDRARLARLLDSVTGAAREAGCADEHDVWCFVAHRSQGLLLCSNTSWPFSQAEGRPIS